MATQTKTEAQIATFTFKAPLLPVGSWDTHHHIFEPEFEYSPNRHLTPPPATIESFLAFKERLGISRSVLTHGLSYGDDCTSLKAFVPRLGGESTTRGVGVIDPESTSDEDILALHAAGVCGIRVNLYRYSALEDVSRQKVALTEHFKRIADLSLSWSMAMTTTRTGFWDELKPFVESISDSSNGSFRLVTDHFALLKAPSMLPQQYQADSSQQPGFTAIMDLVRQGKLWVKLSAPYRVSELKPDYRDLEFLVRAFLNANKTQILWGSDWPHTPRMKVRTHEEAMTETPYLEVDDEAWLRSLRSWMSDEEWNLVMVENPTRLYGSQS